MFGGVVLPCRSAENPTVWVELNDHRLSIEDQTRKLFRNGIVSYRMYMPGVHEHQADEPQETWARVWAGADAATFHPEDGV